MRIPLDYYRILGLPIQATAEQLQQAHRDRTLQLPRRDYSEVAIASRKQLIDEAYGILSDASQRQTYDTQFLADAYEGEGESFSKNGAVDASDRSVATAIASQVQVDPYTPSIEIQDDQLVGALLILLELGEYELVLRLGRPYLSSGTLSLEDGRYGDPDIVLADIVLTVAFACLELGREQWQQGQYENAAESLETGQELLLREGLFPSLRGEIQADLFKLRPYRILELLSASETSHQYRADHQKGLSLLQDMLDERGGIDGTGDDQSGLNVEDFLRFVQQLRSYLTASEQQALFEAEARRPSAVAIYLAVYALIARGFSERQPALIRRGKVLLGHLNARQDVYLELSICALLLGQTEQASQALESSQEKDSLEFIRDHSEGSPDLLPGLCLYAERWLQHEVFPHFRNLMQQRASLKDYFADDQVQAYLEELPNDAEVDAPLVAASATSQVRYSNGHHAAHKAMAEPSSTSHPSFSSSGSVTASTSTATATLETPVGHTAEHGVITMPAAERVSQSSSVGRNGRSQGRSSRQVPPPKPPGSGGQESGSPSRSPDRLRPPTEGGNHASGTATGTTKPRRSTPKGRSSLRLDRILFLAAIALVGVVGAGLAINKVAQVLLGSGQSTAVVPLASTGLSQQARSLRSVVEAQAAATGTLTDDLAQDVIETWLAAKAEAMGENHEMDTLPQILAEPALSQWQTLAEQSRSGNTYRLYEHDVEVNAVTLDEANPDQASVEATVKEAAQLYEAGELNEGSSYDETLRVRYDLIREEGTWRIQTMTVL